MANASMGLPPDVHDYLVMHGVREPEILARLRDETLAIPQHNMQIAPEQGALLALLVELTGAKRCLEIGTFTGYCLGCRLYFLRWWIPDLVTSIWTRGARRQVIQTQPIRFG